MEPLVKSFIAGSPPTIVISTEAAGVPGERFCSLGWEAAGVPGERFCSLGW